jgi:hypothetical protein
MSKIKIVIEAVPYDTKISQEDMNKIIKSIESIKNEFDFEFKFNIKF